jgi:hypothetical protein
MYSFYIEYKEADGQILDTVRFYGERPHFLPTITHATAEAAEEQAKTIAKQSNFLSGYKVDYTIVNLANV